MLHSSKFSAPRLEVEGAKWARPMGKWSVSGEGEEKEEEKQSSGEAEVASAGDTLGILSESYQPGYQSKWGGKWVIFSTFETVSYRCILLTAFIHPSIILRQLSTWYILLPTW